MAVGTHGNAGAAVERSDGEIVGEGAAARAQLLGSFYSAESPDDARGPPSVVSESYIPLCGEFSWTFRIRRSVAMPTAPS